MADEVLVGTPRTEIGTSSARRLRKKGKIPAVVYGHGEGTASITIDAEALGTALRHGARVLDLDQSGATQKVLIRDVQWDAIGMEVIHVDFTRVSADERIRIEVNIELRGSAVGVAAGGVLDHHLHSLQIECPVIAVPESIRVGVAELQIGQAIHVRDLKLPEGVTALSDPDEIVVQVNEPKADVEEEAGAAAPAPGTAEPEVIGRQREAAAEEEG